jgi:hypothetical protein
MVRVFAIECDAWTGSIMTLRRPQTKAFTCTKVPPPTIDQGDRVTCPGSLRIVSSLTLFPLVGSSLQFARTVVARQ